LALVVQVVASLYFCMAEGLIALLHLPIWIVVPMISLKIALLVEVA
jgi:hypothetical protein